MIKKSVTRMIGRLMKNTFKSDGYLNPTVVGKNTKTLKMLPISVSIYALTEYLRRIRAEQSKSVLEIESAVNIPPANLKKIVGALKADYKISAVRTTLNLTLIGGVKIKIGDNVFDDSIGRRILQLGEEISQNG